MLSIYQPHNCRRKELPSERAAASDAFGIHRRDCTSTDISDKKIRCTRAVLCRECTGSRENASGVPVYFSVGSEIHRPLLPPVTYFVLSLTFSVSLFLSLSLFLSSLFLCRLPNDFTDVYAVTMHGCIQALGDYVKTPYTREVRACARTRVLVRVHTWCIYT